MPEQKQKNYTRWSESDILKMADIYDGGLTLREVGAQFGISKQRVEQLLNSAGIPRRKNTRSAKYLESRKKLKRSIPKEILIELYVEQKLPINKILRKLKTSATTLDETLDLYGIPKRDKYILVASPLNRELLHRLYIEEGLTASEIARRYGIATITVQKRLSKFGLKNNKYKKD